MISENSLCHWERCQISVPTSTKKITKLPVDVSCKSVQVRMTFVQRPLGDLHAHRLYTHIVWNTTKGNNSKTLLVYCTVRSIQEVASWYLLYSCMQYQQDIMTDWKQKSRWTKQLYALNSCLFKHYNIKEIFNLHNMCKAFDVKMPIKNSPK